MTTMSFNIENDGICADCNYLSISKLKLVQMGCLVVFVYWIRSIPVEIVLILIS